MNLPRRSFLRLASGIAALPAFPYIAAAQSYPIRPVRVIVPFAPAGSSDITARFLGAWLSEHLGQQFVIETDPGPQVTLVPKPSSVRRPTATR
jgi:tripartite-type tricarboxylate transporter receptor subunit TctC